MMDNFNFVAKKTPILHLSDEGKASWFDIALAIGEIGKEIGLLSSRANVKRINSNEYLTEAKRPPYSVLDSISSKKLIGVNGTKWVEALREMLELNKNNIKLNI